MATKDVDVQKLVVKTAAAEVDVATILGTSGAAAAGAKRGMALALAWGPFTQVAAEAFPADETAVTTMLKLARLLAMCSDEPARSTEVEKTFITPVFAAMKKQLTEARCGTRSGKPAWAEAYQSVVKERNEARLLEGLVSPASPRPPQQPPDGHCFEWSKNHACPHGARCVKALMQCIGLDPALFGAHSLRIGGATAALAAGVPPAMIRLMGRWSSDVYEVYCGMSLEAALRTGTQLASATVSTSEQAFEQEHLEMLPSEVYDFGRPGAGADEVGADEEEA